MAMDIRTEVYKRVGALEIRADLYIQSRDFPTIVYIHGGGMIFGTRKWLHDIRKDLFLACRYNIASFDYRLAPRTKLCGVQEDIRDAVAWLLDEENDLTRNKNYVAFGGSAGGFLALFTGTLARKPRAIVSIYGFGDFRAAWTRERSPCHRVAQDIGDDALLAEISESDMERLPLYETCRADGDWYARVAGDVPFVNPYDEVTGDFPRCFLVHGVDDTDVPCAESLKMHERLLAAGCRSGLRIVPAAGHLFDDEDGGETGAVYEDIGDFLRTSRV